MQQQPTTKLVQQPRMNFPELWSCEPIRELSENLHIGKIT